MLFIRLKNWNIVNRLVRDAGNTQVSINTNLLGNSGKKEKFDKAGIYGTAFLGDIKIMKKK